MTHMRHLSEEDQETAHLPDRDCLPVIQEDLRKCLLEAQRNLATRHVFAAGRRVGCKVRDSDRAFRENIQGTRWEVVGGNKGEHTTQYSNNEFLMSASTARFSHIADAALGLGSGFGQSAVRNMLKSATTTNKKDFPDAHIRNTANGIPVYSLSKAAGKNMTWHVDSDPYGKGYNLVTYIVLGPPQSVNCVVVFEAGDEASASNLRQVDERFIRMMKPPSMHRNDRYDERGYIRLFPVPIPAELSSEDAMMDIRNAYALFVGMGDMIVFDGSMLHGVHNVSPQQAIAFNVATRGIIVLPCRHRRGPRQVGFAWLPDMYRMVEPTVHVESVVTEEGKREAEQWMIPAFYGDGTCSDANLQRSCFAHEYKTERKRVCTPQSASRVIKNATRNSPNNQCFVARYKEGSPIVGSVRVVVVPKNSPTANIVQLCVHDRKQPDLGRRRGIGWNLMKHVIQQYGDNFELIVTIANHVGVMEDRHGRLRTFYSQFGFTRSGGGDGSNGLETWSLPPRLK